MDTLKLGRYPKRIECFDTSHFFGSDLVAAMICFTDGKKESRRTRTFKICDVHKGDDYAALHQVLTRRLLRAKQEEDLPDLILIDGGKGQLHVAEAVLKELDIITSDVISLSKEKGRHDKGLREEKIFILGQSGPILLSSRSPLLFFIQQIRDAAHEKALSFHRLRRKKRVVATALETLPGIGPKKSMRLLSRFGSIKRIQEASLNDLLQVKGITKKDAERLLNYERAGGRRRFWFLFFFLFSPFRQGLFRDKVLEDNVNGTHAEGCQAADILRNLDLNLFGLGGDIDVIGDVHLNS